MSSRQQRRLHNLSIVRTRVEFDVPSEWAGQRVDIVVQKRLPWASRTMAQGWVKEGRVLRNGRPISASRKVAEGDHILIRLEEPWEDVSDMDRIRWQTLYEDERILVVNKPPHLVVHPAGAYQYTTLLNALHKKYLGDKDEVWDDDPVPRLCHRIDKETSGVLVVAFDREAHGVLGTLLQERSDELEKEYLALVEGVVAWDRYDCEMPIGPSPDDEIRIRRAVVQTGQYARTVFTVVERFRSFSLVRCRLFTGRQHQIRVHMQALGHPLVGDHLYGVRDELRMADLTDQTTPAFRYGAIYLDASVSDIEAAERIREVDDGKRKEYFLIEEGKEVVREGFGRLLLSRCALHCARMKFPHPDGGRELEVEAPLTADMALAIAVLRQQCEGET